MPTPAPPRSRLPRALAGLVVAALLALALLGVPAAALAQTGGAFDELTASPTPTATAEDDGGGISISGNTTLFLIGGGLLVAFVVVTWWITRDARSAAQAVASRGGDRDRGAAASDPELRKAAGKAANARKTQARKKGRAQKAARRRNR